LLGAAPAVGLAASKEVKGAVFLPEQAEPAGTGHSLGAVGGAELAQDVADVFLTVSSATTSSLAMLDT
jgi:hypothetical protein